MRHSEPSPVCELFHHTPQGGLGPRPEGRLTSRHAHSNERRRYHVRNALARVLKATQAAVLNPSVFRVIIPGLEPQRSASAICVRDREGCRCHWMPRNPRD